MKRSRKTVEYMVGKPLKTKKGSLTNKFVNEKK